MASKSSYCSNESFGAINKKLQLTPNQRITWQNGLELFNEKKFSEALGQFQTLLVTDPLNYPILRHNFLICSFYEREQKDVECFKEEFFRLLKEIGFEPEKVHKSDINYPIFTYNLAVLYFKCRQLLKTIDILNALIKCKILELKSEKRNLNGLVIHLSRLLAAEAHLHLGDYEGVKFHLQSIKMGNVPEISQSKFKEYLEMKYDEINIKMLLSTHTLTNALLAIESYRSNCSHFKRDNSLVIVHQFLTAHTNYIAGQIGKSLSIMSAIDLPNDDKYFFETGDNSIMIINNNLGCCQFALGKPTIAAWYFQKASQQANRLEYKSDKSITLNCQSFYKKYELMYNFGVSLLHAKKPLEAFNALILCKDVFKINARFWLRLAECCVQIYKTANEDKENMGWTEEKHNILRGVQIQPLVRHSDQLSPVDINEDRPTPTLHYADFCAYRALRLLEECAKIDKMDVQVRVPPSNSISRESPEFIQLLANSYCTRAYISLLLNRFIECLSFCEALGRIRDAPPALQFLGRMYSSEAIFRSGGQDQSFLMFDERFIPDQPLTSISHIIKTSLPAGCRNSDVPTPGLKPASEWSPTDDHSVRALVIYNRAVALVKWNRYEDAASLIDAWDLRMRSSGHSIPADFTLLQIHVHLKLGNMHKAGTLYRQHCPSPLKVPFTK